jgi:filamentous hemagglutinin family protein
MQRIIPVSFVSGAIFSYLSFAAPVMAQVIPDMSLATSVTVGPNFAITGGTRSGNNLFHSFSEFSLPTGSSAIFNNAPDIATIFSRVTGSSISNIDGLIKANGNANLFLLNPNGIFFGPNAKLTLNGSFIATTATTLKFADGSEFTPTTPAPLLSISTPIGLQMGQSPGSILNKSTGFTVKPQKTLALIGGDITIDKAKLTAPQGQIALVSLAPSSNVSLVAKPAGWQIAPNPTTNPTTTFSNINITNATALNADGPGGGAIDIQGRHITINGQSNITASTTGTIGNTIAGAGITLTGSEAITIAGSNPNAGTVTNISTDVKAGASSKGGNITLITPFLTVRDGARVRTRVLGSGMGGNVTVVANQVDILQDTVSSTGARFASTLAANTEEGSQGNGGNVNVTSPIVQIQNGAELRASARGSGNGGNIIVTATDRLSLTGESTTGDPGNLTGMSTSIRENATGQGGSIFLTAGTIEVLNGPAIRTGTYGRGNAGNITVKADRVTIAGYSKSGVVSRFFASAYINEDNDGNQLPDQSTGNGGNITFDVGQLSLLEGGKISASSEAQGRAGEIIVNANTIDIAGKSRSPVQLSFAYALDAGGYSGLFAFSDNTSTLALLANTPYQYGDAGAIRITTKDLTVRDEARIFVSSNANGNAGSLFVNADAIRLSDRGSLRADVTTGSQGNINLTSKLLLLRNESLIESNAGSTANGGNINLNSDLIVQINNSDISANALQGQGGNINLTTKSLIGGAFRPQLTPDSDITAASQFGLNGSVQITTPNVNPNAGLVELPVDLIDPNQKVAQGCQAEPGSSFSITGRGGVPSNPAQSLSTDRPWQDARSIAPSTLTSHIAPPELIEATSWELNPQGQPQLITARPIVPNPKNITCAR